MADRNTLIVGFQTLDLGGMPCRGWLEALMKPAQTNRPDTGMLLVVGGNPELLYPLREMSNQEKEKAQEKIDTINRVDDGVISHLGMAIAPIQEACKDVKNKKPTDLIIIADPRCEPTTDTPEGIKAAEDLKTILKDGGKIRVLLVGNEIHTSAQRWDQLAKYMNKDGKGTLEVEVFRPKLTPGLEKDKQREESGAQVGKKIETFLATYAPDAVQQAIKAYGQKESELNIAKAIKDKINDGSMKVDKDGKVFAMKVGPDEWVKDPKKIQDHLNLWKQTYNPDKFAEYMMQKYEKIPEGEKKDFLEKKTREVENSLNETKEHIKGLATDNNQASAQPGIDKMVARLKEKGLSYDNPSPTPEALAANTVAPAATGIGAAVVNARNEGRG